jgi:3-oxosteroid 1-dehydrogenase
MNPNWDREVDVVVVGTGAAGLTAAITAAAEGQKTLVVESTPKWGGSTALSGGGAWMPTNPLMRKLGLDDSVEKALAYMDAIIGDVGPASSPERRRAFVETVPEVVKALARQGVRWSAARDYPDYYPERVGGMIGRAIETEPFDVKQLGQWATTGRLDESVPIPMKTDDYWLLARAWSTSDGLVRGARVVGRTLKGFARNQRLYGMGAAMTSRFLSIVLRQGTEVLLSTPLTDLVTGDDRHRVVGAVVRRPDGTSIRIRARKGIVLGAGGFAHNTAWREKYHGVPGYSSAAAGDDGSVIAIGESIGAQLALMDDAWWGASFVLPDGKYGFGVSERSMPFSMMVDQAGHRFVNESASYIDVGHAILERNRTVPANPCWLITDARHGRRYLNSAAMMAAGKLVEIGSQVKAPTIEELATTLGMEPATLRATVDRFNGFARKGVDEDFGRGKTSYDNYYGDPRVKPNHNLGVIEKGPFSAFKMVPGDLGTKGGLLTDADARVIHADGEPIAGLYAAGNTTATVMGRTYPGPGSTIAPAMVFAYRGARHAAARDAAARRARARAA